MRVLEQGIGFGGFMVELISAKEHSAGEGSGGKVIQWKM
tara:strand:+ start:107 stop:223 length:117 start_codon:yes stop_codon:yes gene_type:complete